MATVHPSISHPHIHLHTLTSIQTPINVHLPTPLTSVPQYERNTGRHTPDRLILALGVVTVYVALLYGCVVNNDHAHSPAATSPDQAYTLPTRRVESCADFPRSGQHRSGSGQHLSGSEVIPGSEVIAERPSEYRRRAKDDAGEDRNGTDNDGEGAAKFACSSVDMTASVQSSASYNNCEPLSVWDTKPSVADEAGSRTSSPSVHEMRPVDIMRLYYPDMYVGRTPLVDERPKTTVSDVTTGTGVITGNRVRKKKGAAAKRERLEILGVSVFTLRSSVSSLLYQAYRNHSPRRFTDFLYTFMHRHNRVRPVSRSSTPTTLHM